MRKKILICLLAVFIVLTGGTLIYCKTGQYKAEAQAVSMMNGGENMVVEKSKDYIAFYPRNKEVDTGFIFYPGGKVEAESYAALASDIADDGYLVVVPYMPMNLAIFGQNKADEVIESFTNIKNWAIGGHSLGGVMAASYAAKHTDVEGLILYASYPQDDKLKEDGSIEALSLWGSEDKVADQAKIKGAESKLPADAEFIEIEGGNHGGFGEYGHQKGDGDALISNEQQIETAAKYSVQLLKKIDK